MILDKKGAGHDWIDEQHENIGQSFSISGDRHLIIILIANILMTDKTVAHFWKLSVGFLPFDIIIVQNIWNDDENSLEIKYFMDS